MMKFSVLQLSIFTVETEEILPYKDGTLVSSGKYLISRVLYTKEGVFCFKLHTVNQVYRQEGGLKELKEALSKGS